MQRSKPGRINISPQNNPDQIFKKSYFVIKIIVFGFSGHFNSYFYILKKLNI